MEQLGHFSYPLEATPLETLAVKSKLEETSFPKTIFTFQYNLNVDDLSKTSLKGYNKKLNNFMYN